jgi:hypothetical protein
VAARTTRHKNPFIANSLSPRRTPPQSAYNFYRQKANKQTE